VDISEPMIQRCRKNVAVIKSKTPIEVLLEDIRNIQFQRASVVVLNFTLQFLPPEDREILLRKIYDGMLDGGVLILSEKITHENEFTRELLVDIYHDWKRSNGYSDMEVSQKRTALENVLKIDSLPTHIKRLETIGFKHCEQWFQCFNFISMLAFK
ncbi:MAG: carboxy-S-adenosyl-L-methionine synthase CmoA, partial [Victivallales bacterium]|nr:carboxy-S-adenosyl-L-methionine synthase CmoA [Victivallales bacterium]